MSVLIPVGEPESRNIMLIALAVPGQRESAWTYGDIGEDLSLLVGGDASRWIDARAATSDVRLLRTRAYLPLQTAFYCGWLFFADDVCAQEFLRAFPRLSGAARLRRLEDERLAIEASQARGLASGRFDLASLPADRRRDAAQRFLKDDDKRRALGLSAALLHRAIGFEDHWRLAVEADALGPADRSQRRTPTPAAGDGAATADCL